MNRNGRRTLARLWSRFAAALCTALVATSSFAQEPPRMIATVGTIAERDVEETSEAVFGRDEGSVSLGKVGKFLFHTVLQVSDYLQSISSEVRTRVFQGRELRPGIRITNH